MAEKDISIYKRYFVYSKKEAERIKSVNKGIAATNVQLGTVFTDQGLMKPYTSIVTDPNKINNTDAIIVHSGDIRRIKYIGPTFA